MRKLKLDPESLRVDSFAPHDDRKSAKGTVVARSIYFTVEPYQYSCGSDDPTPNCQDTDYKVYTCGDSCINMCLMTGNDPTCIN